MSSKQFITVMAYFMKTVLGNSHGSRINPDNLTIDEISKYLVEVGYTANKQNMTWMKTPNAPHAINSLVDLLQWLCMFLPTTDAKSHPFEESHNLQDLDKCFPNIEYVGLFLTSIKDNFTQWNNQQNEEYESSKAQLIDKYIHMQTDGKVRSKAHIEIETARIKSEYDDQLKKRFFGQDQKKLDDRMAKEEQIKANIKELQSSCNEKISKLNEIKSEIKQQNANVAELTDKVFELKKTFARQPFTKAQIEVKIAKLTKSRQLLEVHKDSVNTLSDMGHSNQIELARALKQLNKVADSFNAMVHEKFLAISKKDWYSFEITDLTIDVSDMTNLRIQIDCILGNFDVIRQRNNAASDYMRERNATLEVRLQAAKANYTVKMLQYENLMEEIKKLEGELKKVESGVLDACLLRQCADNIKEDIEGLKLSIDAKRTIISKLKTQIVQMRDDNNVVLKNYERKGEKLIHIKRKRQKRLRLAVNEIHQSIETLKIEMKKSNL